MQWPMETMDVSVDPFVSGDREIVDEQPSVSCLLVLSRQHAGTAAARGLVVESFPSRTIVRTWTPTSGKATCRGQGRLDGRTGG